MAVLTATTVTTGQPSPRPAEIRSPGQQPVGVPAAAQPTEVATPRYLDTEYVSHAGASPTIGHLRIERLGIDAAVVEVGWDEDAMAVPNDPATLGWFSPSARLDDLAGASLVAGHVSGASDRPGVLSKLVGARVGDIIEWRGIKGDVVRFRVVTAHRYPRAEGLPTSLFEVDGPHTLRLVTCTDREVGARGIHYADNLVVSAVAL